MASMKVKYWPPELHLDGISSGAPVEKPVDLGSAIAAFRSVVTKFGEDELASRSSLFEFSFYDAFGMPPYSFITIEDHISGLKNIIADLFFKPFAPAFKGPHIDPTQASNYIIFRYNRFKPEFVGSQMNKVHLFVKHQYILYAILKLASLSEVFSSNKFTFKFQLFNRSSNLHPENTLLYDIRNDGGVTATIVVYGSSHPGIMTDLLSRILALFPEHAHLGLMEEHGTRTLQPFNIRINKMVSYAASDRGTTLDYMAKNIANISHYTDYKIPDWMKDLQAGCSMETRGGLNRQLQLFAGIDACDASGTAIDYEAKCKEPRTQDMKYCYLSMSAPMVDPRTFFVGAAMGERRRRGTKRRQRRKTRKN
jgi:hypothetical protein